MAHYDYLSLSRQSIPVDLVGNIVEMALITERIESWKLFYPEAMNILERRATIDSVYYSNAIELITDDRARVEALIDGAEPVDTHDLKIIGYYNARNSSTRRIPTIPSHWITSLSCTESSCQDSTRMLGN